MFEEREVVGVFYYTGFIRKYSEKGVIEEGPIKDDKPNGLWKYYDEYGVLLKTKNW